MCCKGFWLRIIPFFLTFGFALLTISIFQKENAVNKNQEVKSQNKIIHFSEETEIASGCTGKSLGTSVTDKSAITSGSQAEPIRITSKPRANYTAWARYNEVQGTVTLRVVFTASGKIGSVSPVNVLPFGLTEQAVAAAKEIKFEPAKKNGVPYTITKLVQYNFTIY